MKVCIVMATYHPPHKEGMMSDYARVNHASVSVHNL